MWILYMLSFCVINRHAFADYEISVQKVCMTETCLTEAAKIKHSIDESIDPCQDFYKFACGGFINRTVIPAGEKSVTNFDSMYEQLYTTIKALLEQPSTPSEPEVIKNLKKLHASCMDTDRIESEGNKPLLELLEKLGHWPVTQGESWNETEFDWVSTLLAINDVGVVSNSLLHVYAIREFHEPDIQIILSVYPFKEKLLQGLKDPFVEKYYTLMVDTAILLGAESRSFAEEELMKSLKLEISLAESIKMDRSYPKVTSTVGNLTSLGFGVNWTDYFNHIFPTNISNDYVVEIVTPFYIDELLKMFQQTPKRDIANFLLWRVIAYMSPYLNSEYSSLAHLEEKEIPEDRWKRCVVNAVDYLPIPVAALFVRDGFEPESKEMVKNMAEKLRNEFYRIIEENTWMDMKTKENALDKLNAISKYIAYPDELLNDTLLDNLYENFELGNDFFSNMLEVGKRTLQEKYSLLNLPTNLSNPEWHTQKHVEAAQINAYYHFMLNSIYVPAGILQGITYNKNRPQYMNYGAIGFILGHELTHGFDSEGRYYDKNGKYISWWDYETDMKYEKNAECLRQQYSGFTLPNGMKTNSYLTLAEDIADNGGLKEAYGAYLSWVTEHGVESILPELHFSQKQLFWLSAAMMYCEKSTDENIADLIERDEHSPFYFRVIGPMRNIPAFSEDYQCKLGTLMNPSERCVVW